MLWLAGDCHTDDPIVATLPDSRFPIVRQYRPALESFTWEFPAGLIDPDEDAATCCRRELMEETGFAARSVHALGTYAPCTARLSNRVHSFYVADRSQRREETNRAGNRTQTGKSHAIGRVDSRRRICAATPHWSRSTGRPARLYRPWRLPKHSNGCKTLIRRYLEKRRARRCDHAENEQPDRGTPALRTAAAQQQRIHRCHKCLCYLR